MCAGSLTAGTSSSSQSPPDNEFETDKVYLKDYGSVSDARGQLGRYFRFYNQERPHQALAYRTPAAVYAEAKAA
jgi:transposase InsO family protein